MNSEIIQGDCLKVMRDMADNSVDCIITDPPYGLKFMGAKWDYSVPSVETWCECLRVLKPGGYLLSFAGTRTQHRMAVNIEDAGYEIRDMIAWVYGMGFPKSLDVSKAIDVHYFCTWLEANPDEQAKYKEQLLAAKGDNKVTEQVKQKFRKLAGTEREVVETIKKTHISTKDANEGWDRPSHYDENGDHKRTMDITAPATDAARQWEGWGTALKPAFEPITVARKPLGKDTVAANVLEYSTGGINVDGCRVGTEVRECPEAGFIRRGRTDEEVFSQVDKNKPNGSHTVVGRFPANFIHDGSDEVVELMPLTEPSEVSNRGLQNSGRHGGIAGLGGNLKDGTDSLRGYFDSGSARFFYCAKASKQDRDEGLEDTELKSRPTMGNGIGNQPNQQMQNNRNNHPTVKPTSLMRYLCRLVCPPGGTVLDPFAGSGSTGKAAIAEGFGFIGIEDRPDYCEIARKRISYEKEKFGLLEICE